MSELRKKHPEVGTCVELFAGGGGLAMGVHNAGFRPLLVNEYAKRAVETLQTNRTPEGERWPVKPGDVRDLVDEFKALDGKVDILAGGPPCQPFSLGGVAKGMEDERNMFPEMFRAVREMRPKAVICENVRGLLRPSFAPYFEYILNELRLPFEKRKRGATWEDHNDTLKKKIANDDVPAAERYFVKHIPVNAANYGVPQIRQRVIIVAFRADLGIDEETWETFEPKQTHSDEALIHSMREGGEYWGLERHHYVAPQAKARAIANLPELDYDNPKTKQMLALQPWRTLRDAIQGIDEFEGRPLGFVEVDDVENKRQVGKIPDHFGWPGARVYTGHTPNLLDRPAKTVKAGVHGVPGGESVMQMDDPTFNGTGYRYMTVRETARVMTFPDKWQLAGPRGEKMRQLGNAVPVKLGEIFANAVGDALRSVGALKQPGGKP
ncbi:DNA cytosine methyltransferase [Streptomyces sp. NPDC002530]